MNRFTLFFSLLLFVSCQGQKTDNSKVYVLPTSGSEATPPARKVNFVRLDDSNPESMFSSISKLVIVDSLIYILDGNIAAIFVYRTNGEYVYTLDKVGQGPGEYIRLRDFNVRNGILYAYDDRKRDLIYYDAQTGTYIGSRATSFFARAFSVLDNEHYLFVLPKDQKHSQVVVTDSSCQIKQEYIPFEEDDLDNHTRYDLLHTCKDKILYSKPGSSKVYVFSQADGSLLDEFRIQIGNAASVEEKQLKMTPFIVGNHLIGNYVDGKERFFFDISFAGTNAPVVSSRNFGDSHNTVSHLLYPIYVHQDSVVVSYLSDEIYEIMNPSLRLNQEEEDLLSGGGFLLGFYHM